MEQINKCECTFQDSGCELYDEYNRCCMLDRIEKILTLPWEVKEVALNAEDMR